MDGRVTLDMPEPLREALAREVEGVPFPELAETVRRLRDAYRSELVHQTPRLDSPVEALAYAAYRMPGTYAAVRAALGRTTATIPALQPQRALDVGGGTGAGAWALAETWPELETVMIQDRSVAVAALGERMAASRSGSATFRWQTGPSSDRVDVAMASYLLGELAPPERARLLEHIFGRADTVVVVEPGTTAGYRRILAARAQMIGAGLSIAAPCPHEHECPLAGHDWCHFAARFSRSSTLRRLKGAEHGHDDEKFSYVVGTRLVVTPADARIIRHPRKRGGLVILQLCDGDGTAHPVTVSKRQGDRYRRARDGRWGDPWTNP
jgi:ribosomal protein RSM22 (predicted rRNA methylase)